MDAILGVLYRPVKVLLEDFIGIPVSYWWDGMKAWLEIVSSIWKFIASIILKILANQIAVLGIPN